MSNDAGGVMNSGAKVVGVLVALPVAVGLAAAVTAVVGPVYAGYRLAKLGYVAHKRAKESSDYQLSRRRQQPEIASCPRLIQMRPLNVDQVFDFDSQRSTA